MKKLLFIVVSLSLFACNKKDDQNWVSLNNLEHWHVYNKTNSHEGWTLNNGILTFNYQKKEGSEAADLISNKQYTNFEFSLEWNISKEGNSGLFWGIKEDTLYKHPYETGPEIQILDDNWKDYVEGRGDKHRAASIFGILAPTKIVSNPAGVWNHYLLHIDQKNNRGFLKFNGTIVLEFPVNGSEWKQLIKSSHFADWKGFGKFTTGHLGLQDHGGKIAFRNLKIRELY